MLYISASICILKTEYLDRLGLHINLNNKIRLPEIEYMYIVFPYLLGSLCKSTETKRSSKHFYIESKYVNKVKLEQ
jgi:hypothetical protein